MDKEIRNRIQRATQDARRLLEEEYAEQLGGTFDILLDGRIGAESGEHLDDSQRVIRGKLVAAVEHHIAGGKKPAEAVAGFLREAAFTTLNRFVALKMLEARDLVQECVSRGEQSSGFKEFGGLARGLVDLPDHGYRLYIESLFDEIGREVRVLFDRRDPASLLWPRHQALRDLLVILNADDLVSIWGEDETIGWVYQYFNGDDERAAMRDPKRGGSQAPRDSRELAVRNQFFTPRYVVQFLTDNTLGRIWVQMTGGDSALTDLDYLVREDELTSREPKDPRDIRVLDPACGSGHFLLYAFDLLLTIYEEAWHDRDCPASSSTSAPIREDYSDLDALRRAAPALILRHNLHGIDIDPRAAQVAALALWMRAQRAYTLLGLSATDRPTITRTNVVVAESMPADQELTAELARRLDPPLLGELFQAMVARMGLAGELGSLLPIEQALDQAVVTARQKYIARQQEFRKGYLPGFEPPTKQGELDLSGIDDEEFFGQAGERIVATLRRFAESVSAAGRTRRRLFAGDSVQGMAFIEVLNKRYDVVLMNPPFGAGSTAAKAELEQAYPRTKNDVYAAFVERGIGLLHERGMLGAITSRTGFFLSSFQRWREEVLLCQAPPVVVADLGHGVMDDAMVEAAAYCLEVLP